MDLLFDTNIILDVLQKREPHLRDSAWAFSRVEDGENRGILGGTTLTTVYYIVSNTPRLTEQDVRQQLRSLLRVFDVARVGRPVLEEALDTDFSDYEDAVLHEAGRRAGAEAVVTRNAADFTEATLAVYTPAQFRAAFEE